MKSPSVITTLPYHTCDAKDRQHNDKNSYLWEKAEIDLIGFILAKPYINFFLT